MAQRPGFFGQLRARLQGEQSAESVEAYRTAGGPAYDFQQHAEEMRGDLLKRSVDPWSAEPATQAFLLCAWNAFVLQTLADQFVAADYQADPGTVGFLPPITAAQALRLYGQVEGWLSRASQAQSNRDYRLDVHVPAELPPWIEVEPCPRTHLAGMIAAGRMLMPHAETAAATIATDPTPPNRAEAVQRLRQFVADAHTQATYAEGLLNPHMTAEIHEQVERHIKGALGAYYRIGQFAVMPGLLLSASAASGVTGVSSVGTLPLPGQPGFDPWCLTDPLARTQWQRDRAARRAIDNLWRFDPDPGQTLAIQAEIDAARERGDIAFSGGRAGQAASFYYCCPWASIYVVRRPVSIGGRQLRTLEEFTYDVSAEEVAAGGAFKRAILTGPFHTTDEIDFCDPASGGHDD